MRKLVYAINLTLDGCCDHTKGIPDEELHDYYTQFFKEADLLVYGRKTYELMVPFWPDMAKDHSGQTKALNDFADAFTAMDKVVFSTTLENAADEKTRIVRMGLHDEIVKLKQEEGKNILLGGADLPSQLIQMGLVDEFAFVIQPVIAGAGRRLLDTTILQESLQLKMIESKILKSGSIAVRYAKA